MELRQLRYFAAVAEAGSLTAAAAQLHMSQPPLSVAIAKLEAELGVSLLVRTPRGVEPTSAGRYLLDAATRVLGDVDEIVSALRRFGSGTAGSITMAPVPVLMWHRIPKLLREYATEAPDVEVRLVDPPPWTAIDMLQQRTVNVAAVVAGNRIPICHTLRETGCTGDGWYWTYDHQLALCDATCANVTAAHWNNFSQIRTPRRKSRCCRSASASTRLFIFRTSSRHLRRWDVPSCFARVRSRSIRSAMRRTSAR